ncbi:MAG: mandelate racemase/muconate lactonizing enzyme family protein [Actinomycetota bacterium]
MSVITEVRVRRVSSPLVRTFVTAVRQVTALDGVLVQVRDAGGGIGWGEAAVSWRVTGESPESVDAAVSGPLAATVIGRHPGDPELPGDIGRAVWGNAAARSAVECAVADLAARHQRLRLADALSGTARGAAASCIRTDMTLSAASPADLAVVALEHVGAGFGALKVKIAAGMDAVASLGAVRRAVGPGILLRIDANQAWGEVEAIRQIRACEDAGIPLEFVEQPVPADALDSLAAVTAAVDTPIMADESVRTARDVRRVAETGAAQFVNIKLAKTGGLSEAWSAATAAREAGLGVVVGCMMEGHVGVAAAAHLAAAFAPDVIHDLDAALWLRDPAVRGGIRYDGDAIELGDGPGIGVIGLAESGARSATPVAARGGAG